MAKYCIGIDLGGTFIKFGTLDEGRQLRNAIQLPTPCDRGPDGIVEQMITGARQLMQESGIASADIAGVGIGAPGPLKIDEGIVVAMPNLPGMEDLPLRDRVAGALGLPAALENDANAAAFGEYLCGAGEGARSMVMLTLGTGIGGGVILDGRILHGSHDMAGELGHIIVEPGGEKCGCGQKGCLERYCSATYIAQRAERRIAETGDTGELAKRLEARGDITAEDITAAAQAGDRLAAEAWDEGAYYLALGCVNICRIFDPDEIVLAGGMVKAGDVLLAPLRKHFDRLHWDITEKLTEIATAKLGSNAGVIGAAGVAQVAFCG